MADAKLHPLLLSEYWVKAEPWWADLFVGHETTTCSFCWVQTASSRAQRHSGHNRENEPTLLSRYNFWQALHQKKGRREERETQKEWEGECEEIRGKKGAPPRLPSLPFFFSPRSAIPPILIGIGPMQQQQQQQLGSAQPVRSLPLYLPRALSLPLYLSIV